MGDVEKTHNVALQYPQQSRFRIKSNVHIAQHDIRKLSSELKKSLKATEVTFKVDHVIDRNTFTTGNAQILKDDLRNPDALLRLIKACYTNAKISDSDWQRILEQVKTYLSTVSLADGGIVRNAKWTLKHLAFDNVFSYGQGNSINFDNLNGVVGIFGSNRVGKSSIVGALMYTLFNSSDRGSLKNLYVCNVREPFCYAKAIFNVNGTDYVIERQTTKFENKKGEKNASTSLNVFKIVDGAEAVDLAGEQRTDTEKVIKSLIGTSEDFMLTSLSAQGDANQFIDHGSAKRRQFLSRFLDLDIFDRMHDLANRDVNFLKAQLKTLPEKDWHASAQANEKLLADIEEAMSEKSEQLATLQQELSDIRTLQSKHVDFVPVTLQQVESQRSKVDSSKKLFADLSASLKRLQDDHSKIMIKQESVSEVLTQYDAESLKKRILVLRDLETTAISLQHDLDKEVAILKQHEKSLKILREVPCGDSFPGCKFIKDAHSSKNDVTGQKASVEVASDRLSKVKESIETLREENVEDKLDKLRQLGELLTKLKLDASSKKVEILKTETTLEGQVTLLKSAEDRLVDMEKALKNVENAEMVSIRTKMENCQAKIKIIDSEKLQLATQKGKISSDIENEKSERQRRDVLLHDMKLYEFISHAFSRKGVPHTIVSSQLPLINSEITKILTGIVDFTIELESDDDSDTLDVYINYGDSRRIIELCSGMEKMVASIAIRVALSNVSSLPKTDMFIVDEGFGVFDEAGIDACNRLLTSLKRYFKTIIVITHVDSVKDIADTMVEVSKVEKNSKVVYN